MWPQPSLAVGDLVYPSPSLDKVAHPPNRAIECASNAPGGDTSLGLPVADAEHHGRGILDVGI
eukprot:3721720-Lingulodinium_polyedra.AAC.1